MNKELIEKFIKIKEILSDAKVLGLCHKDEIWDICNEALQKAKEEQPKDVEEFLSKWGISKKQMYGKLSVNNLAGILTDFANSRKEVTDEEIDFISGKKARENLEKYADQKKYILGFKHCAKWMREQLNK